MLEVLHEHERTARHAWVLDEAVPVSFQQRVEPVVREGLAELADTNTRAELSALVSRPVRWAARLTCHGRDALAYAHARPLAAPDEHQPGPGERLVELRPAQMGAVRVFVSLAKELATAPADGLAERVRTASFSRTDNRWRLCLTEEQIVSVAYGLYLHRLTSSEAEANRFARDYGVTFRPSPATRAPVPVVIGQRTGSSVSDGV
ncbi:DUF6417 family protein [Streptomyces luteogriseus]|uniref:DUF6417 family protein n=1 Tax=Streptomyces luteogriseus TaxID=68233 RepID=UPI0037BB8D78